MEDKYLYVVFSTTPFKIGKFIRFITGYNYNHVSVSLNKDLKKMYSVGRLNPYNTIIGGFVHESLDEGTFKRFYNATATIYEMDIIDSSGFIKIKPGCLLK